MHSRIAIDRMECGDLSPLSAGDLSPSSEMASPIILRTAKHGAIWLASQPNEKTVTSRSTPKWGRANTAYKS